MSYTQLPASTSEDDDQQHRGIEIAELQRLVRTLEQDLEVAEPIERDRISGGSHHGAEMVALLGENAPAAPPRSPLIDEVDDAHDVVRNVPHAPSIPDAEDWVDWSEPPMIADKPVEVKFRFNVTSLADVKTKESEAFVKLQIVFFWSDRRLKYWTSGSKNNYNRKLPDKLWGPSMVLNNSKDMVVEHFDFSLVRPWEETGRLKRVITYQGVVTNPMNLLNFPFDMDDVELRFYSNSHYTTLDWQVRVFC